MGRAGRRHDTTARSRAEAFAKAAELSERLNIGIPTSMLRAKGLTLVEHYLDPRRRPSRGTGWSQRHREEQAAYCRRFVLPVIADVGTRDLRPFHFQRMLDGALTPAVADHLRRCLSAMVAAGLEEGLLLARQDVLRGVHWYVPRSEGEDDLERGVHVDEADIPTAQAVHALARAAAQRTQVSGGAGSRSFSSPTRGCGGASMPRSRPIGLIRSAVGSSSTARSSRHVTTLPSRRPRTDAGGSRCTPPAHP